MVSASVEYAQKRIPLPESHLHQRISAALEAYGIEKTCKLAFAWLATRVCGLESGVADENEFPVLLEEAFYWEGLQIVQLKSAAELCKEAKAMLHCADSYIFECALGFSAIFSVRSKKIGARLSTFELAIERTGGSSFDVTVIQHQGPGNEIPPKIAVQALEFFLHALKGQAGAAWLLKFARERAVASLGIKDAWMAELMRDFLRLNTGGRIDFDMLMASAFLAKNV